MPFTIDALAPFVSFEAMDSGDLAIKAWDVVSDDGALVMRSRIDGGAWSEWAAVIPIAMASLVNASTITVEVKDEEGNVASQTSALIRGKPDGTLTTAGGCGCSAPGSTSSG